MCRYQCRKTKQERQFRYEKWHEKLAVLLLTTWRWAELKPIGSRGTRPVVATHFRANVRSILLQSRWLFKKNRRHLNYQCKEITTWKCLRIRTSDVKKGHLFLFLNLRILHIQTVAWCTVNLHHREESTIQTIMNKQYYQTKGVNRRVKTVCQYSQPTSTDRHTFGFMNAVSREGRKSVTLAYIQSGIQTIHTHQSICSQTNRKKFTQNPWSTYSL